MDTAYLCVCVCSSSNEEGSGRHYTSQVIVALASEQPRTLSYAANTTAGSSRNVPILYGWHVARCAAHLAGCSSSCMCCMQFGFWALGLRVFALRAFTDRHVTVSWGRWEAAPYHDVSTCPEMPVSSGFPSFLLMLCTHAACGGSSMKAHGVSLCSSWCLEGLSWVCTRHN